MLTAAFITTLFFLMLASPLHFARGAGSFSVSITPLYASIDLGESVEFNSTVTGDVIPSEYQWFLNGTAYVGAKSASWTFAPSESGTYNVYLMVYISVTNTTGNETQSEAKSQTARVTAGSQSLTGILGYPHDSSQGGGSGAQYVADGSRFILNVEANTTSMSCFMDYYADPLHPNQTFSYSFAIYRDNSGAVGSLVAQTIQGTILITESHYVPMWFTLSFPSVVHLAPGAYWLMAVHNASSLVSIYDALIDSFETVSSHIGGMTFPDSLPSPVYTSNFVLCIFASWDVSFSARLSEGGNVFAVASNSTVSSLAYNSTMKELSFQVNGSLGTMGYTEVFISKDLLQEPSELTVFIDGEQASFTSTSVEGFWALHFIYSHSTHDVTVNMESAIPEFPTGIFIVVAVCGGSLGFLIYCIKRNSRFYLSNTSNRIPSCEQIY